jgi:uncharacterized protein
MRQAPTETIPVEVAYALPHTQSLITLNVLTGTTALQAVMQSGILEKYPELNASKLILGIFGKRVVADTILHAFNRVEIYRPLLADPKEARRQRAAAKNGKSKTK